MKKISLCFLMICLSLWLPSALAGPPHPSKGWSDPEKKVFRQALKEWTDANFVEVTDCNIAVDFTVRWEDIDFFKTWDADHDYSKDSARVLPESAIPPGWDRNTFPPNEIYFRSDLDVGWFVDPTPADDSEFELDGEGNLRAKLDTGALHKMDLLTIAKHEIGHTLGLDHDPNGVMRDGLEDSVRRHPTADEISRATRGDYTYKFIRVPEPSTVLLLGFGLAMIRRRRG